MRSQLDRDVNYYQSCLRDDTGTTWLAVRRWRTAFFVLCLFFLVSLLLNLALLDNVVHK